MKAPEPVRTWRREQRARLIQARLDAGGAQRKAWNAAIDAALAAELPASGDAVVGLYWPFKGEFNCRPLLHRLHAAGLRPALPAVVASRAPLEFRPWHRSVTMQRGVYDIPMPAPGATATPEIVIAPLVGFDAAGYRLGYGGGYYDRTLAAIEPRPRPIGVGYELARLATIYPQPFDIRMERIVTEAGVFTAPASG